MNDEDEIGPIDEWMHHELVTHKERYERLDGEGNIAYDAKALVAAWMAAFPEWLENKAYQAISAAWEAGYL